MAIHIVVCIKAVVVKTVKGRMLRTVSNIRMNPFDQSALEAALQLAHPSGGTVTALSMGPSSTTVVMKEALAMGVDRAVMASDPALADADTLATATTLAAAIAKLAPVDLVLFGTRSSDSDTGQVGPQTAVALDLPLVTGVHHIKATQTGLQVERTMDHLQEAFVIDYPAALTVRPEAVQVREMPLAGLARAFDNQSVESWSLADLNLSADQVGANGSPTKVLSIQPIRQQRKCAMIEGETKTVAEQLVTQLMEKGLIG